jgi:predicted nuclease of predicted toxin-antitoxin system
MSLFLYMDVHVPRAVTRSLIAAGIDVITAQEDGCARMPDPELLDRASSLGRILFSRDEDLLAEAVRVCLVSFGHAGFACGMHSKLC